MTGKLKNVTQMKTEDRLIDSCNTDGQKVDESTLEGHINRLHENYRTDKQILVTWNDIY